jgi:hypothetical protein
MTQAVEKDYFLNDLKDYIKKSEESNLLFENSIGCEHIFENNDNYILENEIFSKIEAQNFSTTKEQGDLLEDLVKSLFSRIKLIATINKTNMDTALGQVDIQLIPVSERFYSILGLVNEIPKGIIGECKNYYEKKGSKKTGKVSREEIEKMCWRSCKGGCLSFFIGPDYTREAIKEITEFNKHKASICIQSKGLFIIPLSIHMLKAIIHNNLNFCYFIKWAIETTRNNMSITNYL